MQNYITNCFVLFTLIAVIGCDGGQIMVGQPEVFTRSRLIEHRQKEVNWLQNELDKEIQSTFQGLFETRDFQGLIAQGELSFNSAESQLSAAKTEVEVAQLRQSQQLAQLKHELDILKYQRELEAYKNSTEVGQLPTVNGHSQGTSQNGSVTNITIPSDAFKDENRPALPDNSNTKSTDAELTSIEKFRDKLAHRNAVNAVIIEKELDDGHDIEGQSLYTLKFDVTLLPTNRNSDYGQVEMKLESVENTVSMQTYEKFVSMVRDMIARESISLQKKLAKGRLSISEEYRIASIQNDLAIKTAELVMNDYFSRYEHALDSSKFEGNNIAAFNEEIQSIKSLASRPEINSNDQKLLQGAFLLMGVVDKQHQHKNIAWKNSIIVNQFDNADGRQGLAMLLVWMEFVQSLGDYVDMTQPQIGDNQSYQRVNDYLVAIVKSKGKAGLAALNQELGNKSKSYVYSVEPKEQAQNLSDVAAAKQMTNLALAAQARISTKTDAKGYINYLRESQQNLQSILRRPLIVGYENVEDIENVDSNSVKTDSHFGWLFGPRFKIDRKWDGKITVGYEHTAVQHSVQAMIAVPSWSESVELECRNGWSSNGGVKWNTWFNGQQTKRITVKLEPDLVAMTNYLFRLKRPTYNSQPKITWPTPEDHIMVHAERSETLVIHGENLWRNPRVYLGNQPADQIRVLPNMRGLEVKFNNLIKPAHPGDSIPRLDLTVVTSAGYDRVSSVVNVLPKVDQAAKSVTVQYKVPYAIKEKPFVLEVPNGTITDNLHEILLRIKPKGGKQWLDASKSPQVVVGETHTTLSFVLDHEKIEGLDGSSELELALLMKVRPSSSYQAVSDAGIAGSIAYFVTEQECQPTLITDPINIEKTVNGEVTRYTQKSDIEIIIGDSIDARKLITLAHPSLKAAQTSKFTLIATAKGNNVEAKLDLQFSKDISKSTGEDTVYFTARKDGKGIDIHFSKAKPGKSVDLWVGKLVKLSESEKVQFTIDTGKENIPLNQHSAIKIQ